MNPYTKYTLIKAVFFRQITYSHIGNKVVKVVRVNVVAIVVS
jgi:hypothetical protein